MGVDIMLPRTVKPVLSSHPREVQKWPLKAGAFLMEVNIRTKLKFGNILYGSLRQVGCLIEVTANTDLTVLGAPNSCLNVDTAVIYLATIPTYVLFCFTKHVIKVSWLR